MRPAAPCVPCAPSGSEAKSPAYHSDDHRYLGKTNGPLLRPKPNKKNGALIRNIRFGNAEIRRFGIDSETWDYLWPWEEYYKDPTWCEVPHVRRRENIANHPSRRKPQFAFAKALRDARILAEQFDNWDEVVLSPNAVDKKIGFPIVWSGDMAYLYFPTSDGSCPYDEDYQPFAMSVQDTVSFVSGQILNFSHFFVGDIHASLEGLNEALDFTARCGMTSGAEHVTSEALLHAKIDMKGRTISEAVEAMATSRIPKSPVKRWMLDSGCGYDLTSIKAISKLSKHIRDAQHPQVFNTANGPTPATKDIALSLPELLEVITPYILASTPDVLSLGRRCMDLGYGFWWQPYSPTPILYRPDGVEVYCETEGYIPYVNSECLAPVAPATTEPSADAAPKSKPRKNKSRLKSVKVHKIDTDSDVDDKENKPPQCIDAFDAATAAYSDIIACPVEIGGSTSSKPEVPAI